MLAMSFSPARPPVLSRCALLTPWQPPLSHDAPRLFAVVRAEVSRAGSPASPARSSSWRMCPQGSSEALRGGARRVSQDAHTNQLEFGRCMHHLLLEERMQSSLLDVIRSVLLMA